MNDVALVVKRVKQYFKNISPEQFKKDWEEVNSKRTKHKKKGG